MTDLSTIKSWFRTRCKPTEAQFAETFNSFWHKSEKIAISAIQGLMELLDDKAALRHSHEMSDVIGLDEAINSKADTTHSHEMSDINGLSAAFDRKQDAIDDLEDIRHGAELGATALQTHQDISGKADVNHTHSQEDIIGLTDAINAAITNKQDKTDNALLTTAKTIVGAINELFNSVTSLFALSAVRSYTLDFGEHSELVQDMNMLGSIIINSIATSNVAHLYVTYGNVAHQEIDLTQQVSITVPNNTVITWEIARKDDGLACVGIRCSINTSN